MNDPVLTAFYILDLDRTLLDTERAAKIMRDAASWRNTDLAAELTQKIEDYTLYGESFSMHDFIVERVGEQELALIEQKYRELASGQDLLNTGAKELMAYIETRPNTAFGILTFGSPKGQALKIQVSGLGAIPFMVTQETFKGEQISSWRDESGVYHLPTELGGQMAHTIVFVDDKPFSFKGLAADCRGYWVKSLYDAGMEKLPDYVVPVKNLQAIIALENLHA